MQGILDSSGVANLVIIIIGVIIAQIFIIVARGLAEKVATRYEDDKKKASKIGIAVLIIFVGLLLFIFQIEIAQAFLVNTSDVFFISLIFFIIGGIMIYLRIFR